MLELLCERYPEAKVVSLTRGIGRPTHDVHVIITIQGLKIGIESQGDPSASPSRLEKSLREFVVRECHVIICATRTAGHTVHIVEAMSAVGYDVIWRDRCRERDATKYDLPNRAEAEAILERVASLIEERNAAVLARL